MTQGKYMYKVEDIMIVMNRITQQIFHYVHAR